MKNSSMKSDKNKRKLQLAQYFTQIPQLIHPILSLIFIINQHLKGNFNPTHLFPFPYQLFYFIPNTLLLYTFIMGIRNSKNTPKQPKPDPIITYQNMVKIVNDYPITKQYQLLDLIGKGTFAQVYKAKVIQTGNIRAIKRIDRKKNPNIWTMLVNEFDILKECDHPNIIKMYQLFEDYNDFYIVSQLCQGTELYDAIKQTKYFKEQEACQIFYQILSSVAYLHNAKIMHRDLKPQNMMYDKDTKIIKLIDFGTAVRFQNSEPCQRRCVGTSYYVAPQVLTKIYNEKCDVWSLGVILYILLCGRPPFSGKNDQQILKKVSKTQVVFTHNEWDNVSQDAKNLIRKMLTKDITKRISSQQLMKESYFKNRLKNQLLPEDIPFMIKCLQNMKKFQSMKTNKIQEGMLIFIVGFIKNTEDDAILWKCFNKLDANRDGSISREQLKKGFKEYLRMSEKDAGILADSVFQKVDFNHSDAIDYSEFVVSAIDLELTVTQRNLDLAFDYIDSDGSGALDVAEIREKLGENIEQKVYQKLLKEFDANGDGEIDRKEFKEMMKRLLSSQINK